MPTQVNNSTGGHAIFFTLISIFLPHTHTKEAISFCLNPFPDYNTKSTVISNTL
jgi:hypothetical protein